jgi:hypothetical protein
MTLPKRLVRNFILPLAILAPLLWLMAGCFYMPWLEYRTDQGPNVRAVVGPANSDRPIRPGRVTRRQVRALLGDPEFVSLHGTSEAYVARTSHGWWVFPTCFAAYNGNGKAYVVRMTFDAKDQLKDFEWAEDDEPYGVFSQYNPPPARSAVDLLNRSGPKLYEVGSLADGNEVTVPPLAPSKQNPSSQATDRPR